MTEDVKNKANYSAYQVSVGGGIGLAAAIRAAARPGHDQGQPGRGRREQRGEHLRAPVGNLSFKPPTVAAASGSGSSTTSSAISGGTIVIRDEAASRR